MKKFQLTILLLIVIALLISADYFINLPDGLPELSPSLPGESDLSSQEDEAPINADYPNVTKQVLQELAEADYTLEKRSRSTELFESFNLSEVANVVTFRNILIGSINGQAPLYVYEIHAPSGQGAISYLNIKLTMLDQLRDEAGINETGDIGYSSLFYNDPVRSNTAFLLSQVGDMIFGFQYDRNSTTDFDFVKDLVNNYMSSIE